MVCFDRFKSAVAGRAVELDILEGHILGYSYFELFLGRAEEKHLARFCKMDTERFAVDPGMHLLVGVELIGTGLDDANGAQVVADDGDLARTPVDIQLVYLLADVAVAVVVFIGVGIDVEAAAACKAHHCKRRSCEDKQLGCKFHYVISFFFLFISRSGRVCPCFYYYSSICF